MAEDFTTYTETDPESRATVTAEKIAVAGIISDEVCRVYRDKGGGHFGAAFEHDFEVTWKVDSGRCINCSWAVTNVPEQGTAYWDSQNSQAINVGIYDYVPFVAKSIFLREEEDSNYDLWSSLALNTKYRCTPERAGDTTMQLRIYEDDNGEKGDLIDTLTVPVPSGRSYQYIMAMNSYEEGLGGPDSLDIESLELNEAAAAASPPHLFDGMVKGAV